ncbi:PTS sugar transporter subunit IIA [Pelosinus propionicus]|uniref:PTS system D-fructose-specific IIA component (F1P-forming), Frc family n=1 Tax=Pelosinus propionicus DSM 13327 TaxID=1123291 RepID=A0A1I4J9M7_9FIRM|nr:PTS sugar transporter subunit IIA [Pelosinus propionicus]SFL63269.1 PTS system D-fructose-specific IIA component (F1P-forming), Frc family [Pelosinus propionicus DSM 13327]
MNIQELLSASRVKFHLMSSNKLEVINELIDVLNQDGKLLNKDKYKEAVLAREKEFSTGIGMGIAIPHAKDSSVKEASLTLGISKAGIDYEALDGSLAHIFFLIAVPAESNDVHLKVLSYISRKLMHQEIRDRLLSATTYEEILAAFND